jgi:hypothetical protein
LDRRQPNIPARSIASVKLTPTRIGTPGIEVLSEALWTLPPAEIGRGTREALAATLACWLGRLVMR